MTHHGDVPFGTTTTESVVGHLRRLRSHGMTNKQIGERAGVPRTTVANLVGGHHMGQGVNVTTASKLKAVMPPRRKVVAPEWRERAACRDWPGTADDWVINLSTVDRHHRRNAAKVGGRYAKQLQVCAGCPVKDECLADELDYERQARASNGRMPRTLAIRGGLLPYQIWKLADEEFMQ